MAIFCYYRVVKRDNAIKQYKQSVQIISNRLQSLQQENQNLAADNQKLKAQPRSAPPPINNASASSHNISRGTPNTGASSYDYRHTQPPPAGSPGPNINIVMGPYPGFGFGDRDRAHTVHNPNAVVDFSALQFPIHQGYDAPYTRSRVNTFPAYNRPGVVLSARLIVKPDKQ